MQLSKVPNPVFPSIQDIALYTMCDSLAVHKDLYGSSLNGQRSIADFFKLLDHFIRFIPDNDYKLQKLDDILTPLTIPPVERSSPGIIAAGNYLILPTVEGGEIAFRPLGLTFFNLRLSPTATPLERAANLYGVSTTSERSSRDPPIHPQSFQMRLVHRDKGCAVCLAAGIPKVYEYDGDSDFFKGGHIIDLAYHALWDAKGYPALVRDPYTDPANANNRFASPSTRTKKDSRRMNSLENGILFCLKHHRDYKDFRFSIHPETHEIFSFYPDNAALQGVEVKAPWDGLNPLYPPPLPAFLQIHYFSSIAKATMKGGGDGFELDDDDDDCEELSELEEV